MGTMSAPLYFNGRYTTTDERVLGVEDRGFQFGDGVYEVVKFEDGKLHLTGPHLKRLRRGLDALGIAPPFGDAAWLEIFRELQGRCPEENGTIYLQVSRGEASRSCSPPFKCEPTVLAYARPATFPGTEDRLRGVKAVTVPDLRWSRCDIKSVNLLGNVMARQACREAGADEALLVRDGTVREGAHANLFVLLDGLLVTHPADHQILWGTVREQVLELAYAADIAVEERPVSVGELATAEEVFITSTSLGVMPVTEVDGRSLTAGAVTMQLSELFESTAGSSCSGV